VINIESSTRIERPRDEVFDFLTDVNNLPAWQSGVTEARSLSEAPVRIGFQFKETAKVGPWKLRNVCIVTDLKTNERYAFQVRSSGPIDCDVTFDLQPVTGGTRLTVTGKGRLKGVWRLMQPMLAREMRKGTQAELTTLRQLLEAAQPATPRPVR
jgi:carbon monoxide dehydrogenase subunit G